ncbi:MAG: Uncharacterised protein [Alphaproteobacteria bacterium]|nr:MAG: Uncharacterised protein [Alphaproteobacteria bacterium]
MFGITVLALSSWGLRLAIAAPLLAITLIALFRLGVFDFRLPLLGVAVATFLAIVALLLSIAALIGGFGGDGAHIQNSVIALVLSLAVLYAPVTTIRKGGDVPRIHDISTDLDNPPVFETVPGLRAASDNSLEIDEKVQAAQKAHYTAIVPLTLPGTPGNNFAAALAAAENMGWEIVASNAAQGHIEATATTALFGFKDDVVIRLSAVNDGTRVDVRSASRVGLSDLGANAARIQAYLAKLD